MKAPTTKARLKQLSLEAAIAKELFSPGSRSVHSRPECRRFGRCGCTSPLSCNVCGTSTFFNQFYDEDEVLAKSNGIVKNQIL